MCSVGEQVGQRIINPLWQCHLPCRTLSLKALVLLQICGIYEDTFFFFIAVMKLKNYINCLEERW